MKKEIKEFETEYGTFTILTRVKTIRGRKVKLTGGWFNKYPQAVTFFPENDFGTVVIASSQGDSYADTETFCRDLGFKRTNYDKLLSKIYPTAEKCFDKFFEEVK